VAKLTPAEFREKHARRLKGSMEDMRIGIGAVTEAPGKKAAAKADKMKANLVRAVEDGTWARRVGAVTLEDWKGKMLEKGLSRIPQGIDAAASKVEDFAAQLLPHTDKVKEMVSKMPDLTLEDNISRASKAIREMAKFSKK